jgi:arylsulfatase A-like enzyme
MGSGKIFHAGFPDPVSWDVYWPSHSVTKPMDPVLPVRTLDSRLMDSLGYGEKFGGWDWGPLGEADTAMGDWKVTDWVIGQLRKDHDKPFFLACGISKPHLKWHVPAKYFDLYPLQEVRLPLVKEDDLADIPPAGSAFVRSTEHQKVLESQQWHRAVQAYQASITFADVCVGRVLDALERSRYNRNTIVVLWSDHGFALGEKQHWRKFVLWEDVIKTVFVIHDTRDASKGHKVEDPVSLLDIYPTLVDLCGLTPKKELEGNDLSSLLKNPAIFWNKPVLTTHNRGNHSLRWRNWHYIRYADGSQELYDLNKDPHEWENLADEKAYAWVIRKLAKDLPRTEAAAVHRAKRKIGMEED